MSDTRTDSVTELEELLDNEIPCGGITDARHRRSCDKAADLRGRGHGCFVPTAGQFKCITCWQAWLIITTGIIARFGHVRCSHCKQCFTNIEAFSDYRPF